MDKKHITYIPQGGVCSKKIIIDVIDNKIEHAQVIGGCDGNLQGICSLIKGLTIQETICRLEGINCRGKGTSCPDQIAIALKQIL